MQDQNNDSNDTLINNANQIYESTFGPNVGPDVVGPDVGPNLGAKETTFGPSRGPFETTFGPTLGTKFLSQMVTQKIYTVGDKMIVQNITTHKLSITLQCCGVFAPQAIDRYLFIAKSPIDLILAPKTQTYINLGWTLAVETLPGAIFCSPHKKLTVVGTEGNKNVVSHSNFFYSKHFDGLFWLRNGSEDNVIIKRGDDLLNILFNDAIGDIMYIMN